MLGSGSPLVVIGMAPCLHLRINMPAPFSYLDLVKATDAVPYPEDPEYQALEDTTYLFLAHDGVAIGRVVDAVAKAMAEEPIFNLGRTSRTIQIAPSLSSFEERNKEFAHLAAKWLAQERFEVLQGWRSELYTVFNPSQSPYLLIERAAAALFGFITYGVHIVGYIPANLSTGAPLRIWVPRRSATKATFPGMLDNTVAGGLGFPHGIYDTAVKECAEEAGLSESYVESRLKAVGVISYNYRHKYDDGPEVSGLFQPEVEYLYDLEMDEDTIPRPADGEVAEFNLMTVDQVKKELFAGSFKPNTALVQIDFFVRHGIITPENEPSFLDILVRTHRRLDYPVR